MPLGPFPGNKARREGRLSADDKCEDHAVAIAELRTKVRELRDEAGRCRQFRESMQGLGWKIIAYGLGTVFVQVVIGVLLVGQVKAYVVQLGTTAIK